MRDGSAINSVWGLSREKHIYKHAITWEFHSSFFQLPFYCIFHLFCSSFHFISYFLIDFFKLLINVSIPVQLPHSNLKHNHNFCEDHNHPSIFSPFFSCQTRFFKYLTPLPAASLLQIISLTVLSSSHLN